MNTIIYRLPQIGDEHQISGCMWASAVLFTRCSDDLQEVTVNAAEKAVGFYEKVGFRQSGDRFFKHGIWGTPMKWINRLSEAME